MGRWLCTHSWRVVIAHCIAHTACPASLLVTESGSSRSSSRTLPIPSKSGSSATTSVANLANHRAGHLAQVHHAANQLRLEHPAKGLPSSSPQSQRSSLHAEHADLQTELLRYTLEMEVHGGDKDVQKRISVIFPLELRTVTAAQVGLLTFVSKLCPRCRLIDFPCTGFDPRWACENASQHRPTSLPP